MRPGRLSERKWGPRSYVRLERVRDDDDHDYARVMTVAGPRSPIPESALELPSPSPRPTLCQ